MFSRKSFRPASFSPKSWRFDGAVGSDQPGGRALSWAKVRYDPDDLSSVEIDGRRAQDQEIVMIVAMLAASGALQ